MKRFWLRVLSSMLVSVAILTVISTCNPTIKTIDLAHLFLVVMIGTKAFFDELNPRGSVD